MPDTAPYLTAEQFRARLANGGGIGARTASELPDERLESHVAQASSAVVGRLRHFDVPAPDTAGVPDLLLDIISGYAGYTATLEHFGSQPLEDRDPVVLRYQWAREQLADLRSGVLVVEGIAVPDDASNPDATDGDPEAYQPPSPYLGLAEGLTPYGGEWSGSGRDWSHGSSW